jgi:hypothetical protein
MPHHNDDNNTATFPRPQVGMSLSHVDKNKNKCTLLNALQRALGILPFLFSSLPFSSREKTSLPSSVSLCDLRAICAFHRTENAGFRTVFLLTPSPLTAMVRFHVHGQRPLLSAVGYCSFAVQKDTELPYGICLP